jgi:hypothetical protein
MRMEIVMNPIDMLKDHQIWLDRAHAALTSNTPHDVRLLLEHKQQRIRELNERVAGLYQTRDATIARYDAAIGRCREELAKQQFEMANDEKLLQPPATPHVEQPAAQSESAAAPAKAAASKRPKTAAKRRTKAAKSGHKPKT